MRLLYLQMKVHPFGHDVLMFDEVMSGSCVLGTMVIDHHEENYLTHTINK